VERLHGLSKKREQNTSIFDGFGHRAVPALTTAIALLLIKPAANKGLWSSDQSPCRFGDRALERSQLDYCRANKKSN
jgi:hypothetical protein